MECYSIPKKIRFSSNVKLPSLQLAPATTKISPSTSLPKSPELTITPIETKTTTPPSGGTPSSPAPSTSLSASSPYDPMKRLLSLMPPDHKDVDTKAKLQTPASQASATNSNTSTSSSASTTNLTGSKVAQPINRKLSMAPASPPNSMPTVSQIQLPTQGHRKPHIPIAALPNRPIAPRPAQVSMSANNNNHKIALLSTTQPKSPPPAPSPQTSSSMAAVVVSTASAPTSIKS